MSLPDLPREPHSHVASDVVEPPVITDVLAELLRVQERLDRAEATIERLSTVPTPTTPNSPPVDGQPLRRDITDHEGPSVVATGETTGRRHLLKQVGIAAGAAAAAGITATAAAATPAAAADGSALTLGVTSNNASSPTRAYNPTGTDVHLFEFSDHNAGATTGSGAASLSGHSNFLPIGVLGDTTKPNGVGVYGRSAAPDTIAVGASATGVNSIGVAATATKIGIRTLMSFVDDNVGVSVLGGRRGMQVGGCLYPLSIPPNGNPGPPTLTGAPALVGDIYVDGVGVLYHCVADGSPGTWLRLAGPGTAGALTAITPTRVYDSRLGSGRLTAWQSRVCSVAHGINITSGAVAVPNLVPVGATAVQYNVTVTETEGSGYLQVAPGDATGITSSSINWTAHGQTIANGLLVKVDSNRDVKVSAGPGSTHFILDVLGYYR